MREPSLILVHSHFADWRPPLRIDCPIACEITTDRARLGEAAAVVHHIPSWRGPQHLERRPGQAAIAWSQESEANYPLLADPAFMGQFDATMSYRQDATVWWPYFTPADGESLLRPPCEKTASAPVAYFASNPFDRSGRTRYVLELMRHLAVDSYGRVLRNRRLEQDQGHASKLATIARYRFTLAFENSICRDYVTEKFFDPLLAGSVPVYLGAPNVAELAPGERCYIDVRDFASATELAARLSDLCADERAYGEYHAWRTAGLTPAFLAQLERLRGDAWCRLCRFLRDRRAA